MRRGRKRSHSSLELDIPDNKTHYGRIILLVLHGGGRCGWWWRLDEQHDPFNANVVQGNNLRRRRNQLHEMLGHAPRKVDGDLDIVFGIGMGKQCQC